MINIRSAARHMYSRRCFSSIAGSEASSITLTYLLGLLIKHPEMDKRLRSELSTLPNDYSSADLALLPYLDAFIRETLRIYPPAPSPMPRVVPSQGLILEGVEYPPHVSSHMHDIHCKVCSKA